MFCTNCGAKLPEGSKFCMECGAKVAFIEEPAPLTENWNEPPELVTPVVEEETVETVETTRPMVSFDWSNVKEESHKKEVPEVHSPWGTTGLSEKELFAEIGAPSEDSSRTMSFIDILKKERDARAQAAEEVARPVTEREEPVADYSAFEEAPSFYVPPMYDDVEGHTVTPFEEPVVDDDTVPFEDTEEIKVPSFISEYLDEQAEEAEDAAPEAEEPAIAEPETEEPAFVEPEYAEPEAEEPEEEPAEDGLYHTLSFEGPEFDPSLDATEDLSDLESSLAAILEAGAGKTVSDDEAKVDLFEGVSEDASVEDLYLNVEEEPVSEEVTEAYEAAPIEEPEAQVEEEEPETIFEDSKEEEPFDDFAPMHGAVDEEELTIENEEDFDEEDIENLENLYISEDEMEEDTEDVYDPEAIIEDLPEEEPVTVESEIDALKRRLAELMGEPEEPEEIVKDEPNTLEDLFGIPEEGPEEEPVSEAAEEELAVELPAEEEFELEIPVEEEFEVELSDEEPEEEDGISLEEVVDEVEEELEEDEAEEEEKPVEEPKSDAISIEELERDLFGDVDAADAEPEATKKIDKFYTLYKKNEEFQKLLDEEYNKLQSEEKVPHVEDFVPVEVVKDEPATVVPEIHVPEIKDPEIKEPEIKETAPVDEAAEKIANAVSDALSKREEVAEKPAGGVLTVLAVIVAVLLVILLAIILVLNFAPDSGIAMSIDSIIETITSMFSDAGTTKGLFLL